MFVLSSSLSSSWATWRASTGARSALRHSAFRGDACRSLAVRRSAAPSLAATPPRRVAPPALQMNVFLTSPTTAELKQKLLDRVADLDLGRRGYSPEQDRVIDEYFIRPLEAQNPTRYPVDSPLLGGRWRLVYSNSKNVLGMDRPPFIRPAGNSVYQTILLEQGMVINEERMLGLIPNKVRATFTVKPPRRVEVQFQEFRLGPIKARAPRTARGWLDITYLDEDMRISRGNLSNVFVLVRE